MRRVRTHVRSEIVFAGAEASFELLHVSKAFLVDDLTESIIAYLMTYVRPSNCCTMWNTSHKALCLPLEERCMDEMATNFEEVATYEDFLKVEEQALEIVMKRDDLQCTEEKVFEALLCWVNHKVSKRQNALDRLLPLCRLALIDTVYLQDYVDGNALLRKSKVAGKLLTEAYKYQASPAHRRQALMPQMKGRSTQRQPVGTSAPRLMDVAQYAPMAHQQYASVPAVGMGGWGGGSMHGAPPMGYGGMQTVQPSQSFASFRQQPSAAPLNSYVMNAADGTMSRLPSCTKALLCCPLPAAAH